MSMVAKSEKMVVKIENQFSRGFLTNDERYRLVVKEWEKTTNDVSDALQKGMDQYNPIFMMADSGARGSHGSDPSAGWYARLDGQHLPVRPSRSPSSPTSAKACPFWNTSSPPEALVRACRIPLCVPQTPVT